MLRQSDDHLRVSSEVVEATSSLQIDYEARNTARVSDTKTASTNANTKDSETVRRYSELLVPKSNWSLGDIKVPCAVPLQLPVTKVYVEETKSKNCFGYGQCKDLLLDRQRSYYENSNTDIQSNFLIVEDGSIFEGLTWEDVYKRHT